MVYAPYAYASNARRDRAPRSGVVRLCQEPHLGKRNLSERSLLNRGNGAARTVLGKGAFLKKVKILYFFSNVARGKSSRAQSPAAPWSNSAARDWPIRLLTTGGGRDQTPKRHH